MLNHEADTYEATRYELPGNRHRLRRHGRCVLVWLRICELAWPDPQWEGNAGCPQGEPRRARAPRGFFSREENHGATRKSQRRGTGAARHT